MTVSKGIITDPVGDLFARIRNAARVRQQELPVPYSSLRENIVRVLKKEGYVADSKKKGDKLLITLAYKRRQPLITGVRNVSKPGLRIYRGAKDIREPLGGAGITIVSTPGGVMSSREAKKKGLGGEVLGEVW